jgi:hypothetical protein
MGHSYLLRSRQNNYASFWMGSFNVLDRKGASACYKIHARRCAALSSGHMAASAGSELAMIRPLTPAVAYAAGQGLTLVHVRAQHEQLRDTFMS